MGGDNARKDIGKTMILTLVRECEEEERRKSKDYEVSRLWRKRRRGRKRRRRGRRRTGLPD